MIRSILTSKDEVLLAVLELCEDRKDISIDELVGSFTDYAVAEDFPKEYTVESRLYCNMLYMVDLLDRIAESKGISFTTQDIVEYIIRYFASVYMPDRSREDYTTLKPEVLGRVLEDTDFNFAEDFWGGGSSEEDVWRVHQRSVEDFKKKYRNSKETCKVLTEINEKFNMENVWNSKEWFLVGKSEGPFNEFTGILLTSENPDKDKSSWFQVLIIPHGVEPCNDSDRLLVTKESFEKNWLRQDIFKIQKDLTANSILLYNEDRSIMRISTSTELIDFMKDSYKDYVHVVFSISGEILYIEKIPENEIIEEDIDF